MAELQESKKLEASLRLSNKPSAATLGQGAWLSVAELQVDYSYQHPPYASAIEALRKEYEVAYSGFILVNQRVDGTYWIIDGQTRTAVHTALQYRWIKAEVLHGLTQAEEAGVYLFKCLNVKRMPVDYFQAEYTAGRPVAVLIKSVLAKRGIAIESYATTQRRRGVDAAPAVTCVSYLKRMIGRDPKGEALGMTLDLIADTWEYSRTALTATFLDSLHKIIVTHAGELDRKTFIAKLAGHRPEELRDQALVLRMGSKLSVGNALQHVIIDLYNTGRPQQRRISLGSPNRS